MPRQQLQVKIPQEYKDNEAKGLCRVCGKPREEFEPRRSLHCSEDCAKKYQSCFLYWDSFRAKIIIKNPQCKECGSTKDLEVDHIIPVAITGEVFDEDNCQVLCRDPCHLKKTKKDLKKIKNHKNNQTELNKFAKTNNNVGDKDEGR